MSAYRDLGRRAVLASCAALLTALAGQAFAQPRPPASAPAPPKAGAPIDITGYWVAVVSEDWRHRMATPRKGDYESLPLNANGRRTADGWNLDADNAAGVQCKAFGVGGLIRQPGRLHVTWADDDTLRVDFDAGTQTRLLEFASTRAAERREDLARLLARAVAASAASRRRAAAGADRQQHGTDRAGRRRSRPARRPRSLAGARRGRLAQSRHDEFPRGVSAQERRAVQRVRIDHGVLPSLAGRAERRRLSARRHDRRGSRVPQRAVLHEHDVQARSERREVEPDTVPHRAAAGRSASGRASRRAVAALSLRPTYKARFRGSVAARFRCEIPPRRDFPLSSLRAGGASGEALRSRSESRRTCAPGSARRA